MRSTLQLRKPRWRWFGSAFVCVNSFRTGVFIQLRDRETLTAGQCRKMAAWLLKAAEWLEAGDKK